MTSTDHGSDSSTDSTDSTDRIALCADDSLRWMKVWPAAEAVYFRADEEEQLRREGEADDGEERPDQRDERQGLPGHAVHPVGVPRALVLGDEHRPGDGEPAADREQEEDDGEGEAQRAHGRRRVAPQPERVGQVVRHLQHVREDDGYREDEQRLQQSAVGDVDRRPPVAVERPVAVVVALAVEERRETPAVAVVGFDDRRAAAHAWPPLSTVAQPSAAIGSAAAASMLAALDGERGESRSLATTFVSRQSA